MLAPDATITRSHRLIWLLLVSGLLLAWPWASPLADDRLAWILAGLVVVFGLPHGAMDPMVARAAGRWRTTSELMRHLAAYLGLALAVVGLWLLAPLATLSAFLLMSAWHFGDDWPERPGGQAMQSWQRLLSGLGVVGSPVLFHPERVSEIFSILVAGTTESGSVGWLVQAWQPLAAAGLLHFSWRALVDFAKDPLWSLELATLALSAWWFEPLIYFAVYFCFLHSPRHLLRAGSDPAIGLGPKTVAVITAMTLLTVILGWLAFALMGDGTQPQTRAMQIVFVGLAALTVPHMLLVERYAHGTRSSGQA